jgi:hypothetical protein
MHINFIWNPEENKRWLGTSTCIWEDIIKIELRGSMWEFWLEECGSWIVYLLILLPIRCSDKNLVRIFHSSLLATCSTHYTLLDFIVLIRVSEKCKHWSYSICNILLQAPALGFSAPCPHTLSVCRFHLEWNINTKRDTTRILFNLNSVNQLIFVMVKCGVLFEVRTGFLNNI